MNVASVKTPLAWAGAVLLLDQLSKLWVASSFLTHESLPVIPGLFSLTFVTNTGAAFGILAGAQSLGRQVFFVGVALVALVVLYMAYREYRAQGQIYMAAIGLVAGGALGNLVDRLRLGHVIDFLDFYLRQYHWPAFNIADSAITIGVGLFLLAGFREHGQEKS
ncbi:MAG: signal peptidase II [Desulfobulbaceae bacterium]|nr:signal peptidase II [Desulfobulbaceae bacterium]